MTDEQFEKELKEIVPIDELTEEERAKAKEIAKNGHMLDAVKYINKTNPNLGLKLAKAYYELYLDECRQD